ncbi:PQQ-dependent sugar dehydrogenase [soil metagenome]
MKRLALVLGLAALVVLLAVGVAPASDELGDPIERDIPEGDIQVSLEPLATGLTAPNWGTSAPGISDRLFVTDQDGILWNIDLASGEKSVFLDVSDRLIDLGVGGPGTFDERGLLGVAFDPGYATNGLFYTYTSEPVSGPADFSTMPEGMAANHQSVITEWRVLNPGDPNSGVDPDSDRVLFTVDQPQFNHNAGAMEFGPDGMLYIAFGDGGAADDQGVGHVPQGNGQEPGNILGTIARIEPTGANSDNGQYGIPVDNPFVGQDGFLDEIFAYGFRNPFRFSFDSATGTLLAGDVGQNHVEEVDVVNSGGNYGWRIKEGSFLFDPNGQDEGFVTAFSPGEPAGLIDPIAEYAHDDGVATIGGFVYHGQEVPELQNLYVFGDTSRRLNNEHGRVFYLDENGQIFEALDGPLGVAVLGFGQDAAGEVYVMVNEPGVPFGNTGMVLKVVPECADGDVGELCD